MTCTGFCDVAAESRYTIGLPSGIVRSRIGKSARIRARSSGSVLRSCVTAMPPPGSVLRLRRRLAEVADPLVALLLELLRELAAAGLHDTSVHHHVDVVRRAVVQDPLVVRDEQHAEVRADQLRD